MAKAGQRKCMSCGEFFVPDHRSGERQRYCCAADCRRASKASSCVFRTNVTARFGIVTGHFGSVTGRSGDVTAGVFVPA